MGKRVIFYDYKKGVDMMLPSCKRLFKRLGDYDTLAEYTVCTVLDFEKYSNPNIPFSEYVSQKATEHGVNLRGGVSLGNYKSALVKSFLVNSHAALSDFIRHYRDDIQNLITRDFRIKEDDKMSELERLLASLKSIGLIPLFPDWLLPTMEYYRHVRNCVAHSKKDKKACDIAYKRINLLSLNADYYVFKNKAPNPEDNINMDDFYFYSACIKHVANYLVMVLKGHVDWNKIGETHVDLNPHNIEKGTDTEKLVNRVFQQYNHRGTQEEIRNVMNEVIARKKNALR